MKKNIINFIILFPLWGLGGIFGQSVTIVPSNTVNTEFLKINKPGIGLDHRLPNGLVGVGTYASSAGGYIQTHTNHPLYFATNNGNNQMALLVNGNFGIGVNVPTQKLHVEGNAYVSGNLDSDGSVSANTLTVGGGSTINKFIKVLLSSQQIFGVVNNTCSLQYYSVAGADFGDIVILNMDSPFSTLVVANVRVTGLNQVEVKFCNIGNSNTILQTGISMRFTVIK